MVFVLQHGSHRFTCGRAMRLAITAPSVPAARPISRK